MKAANSFMGPGRKRDAGSGPSFLKVTSDSRGIEHRKDIALLMGRDEAH
jgi:hypothetical protein